MAGREIPAFLSIDVEPDGFQLPERGPASWTGYDDAERFVESLRGALADVGPATPQFSWYLRMDPQIAAVSPRVDQAVSGDRDRIDRITRRGDKFGLHIHPVRWSDRAQQWIHDFADPEWTAHCLESSVAAFEQAFGSRPLRHRYGAGYLASDLVAQLDELGVGVDLTLEANSMSPERRADPPDVETGVDATPRIGVIPDCSRIPRTAYRPSRVDGLRVDDCNGRNIVLIPLTAIRRRYEKPMWWRAASRLKHGLKRPPVKPLYASETAPRLFWDIVEREIERMPRPYVSISYRTDAPGSPRSVHVRAVIEHLPSHPLARRLRFTDPLEVAPSLLAPRARAHLSWAAADGASRVL